MLDRLFDFILNFLGLFKFWAMLYPYEYGIILTLGKTRRKNYLKGAGGFYFILPFNIEEMHPARTDIQTYIMQPQTLMCKDQVMVTVKMACVWQLENVEYFLLKLADDEQAMYTQCYCALAELVRESNSIELLTEDWNKKLWARVRDRAKKYGVKMLEFELIEFSKTDVSMRLYNEPTQTAAIGVTI